VPAGACDTHAHVFAARGRLPYAERRPYTPAPDTGHSEYAAMHRAIGIGRGVLVHSNIYGPDNRATLEALAAEPLRLRGVCVIRPEIRDEELKALHPSGMRGTRINLSFLGEVSMSDIESMGRTLADLGWHVQAMLEPRHLDEIADRVRALPVDFVVDHMALIRPGPTGAPALAALLRLLETGRVWVKLSAPYHGGVAGPVWSHASEIARRLTEARPDRMLWGTNWPHPNADPVPDDGDLMDWIAAVAASPERLQQILVTNPPLLYGF
jgi:predicted TIM-barrel fold metal-dependent hydrolase